MLSIVCAAFHPLLSYEIDGYCLHVISVLPPLERARTKKIRKFSLLYALLYLRPDSTTVPLVDAKLSGPT